ncbi:NUDIX domain-containing protein [Candidatus Woesearchaeota archaeon]|nr:NUDIX domain-containing protein [Candidatus Woesearchaeota archaeon]
MKGVSVIIKKDDKYLLLQQARGRPFELKWMPPSGAVEEGEELADAAKREVKEETGLEIENLEEAAMLKADYKADELHFFTADWKSGDMNPDIRELNKYGWFTKEEIKKLDLMKATKEFFERYSEEM